MYPKLACILVNILIATTQVKAYLHPELIDKCLKNPTGNVEEIMLELTAVDTSPATLRGGQGKSGVQENHVDCLKRKSDIAQFLVMNAIKSMHPNANTKCFWVANIIAILNVPCSILIAISSIPGVLVVRMPYVVKLQSVGIAAIASDTTSVTAVNPQWGVAKINAPSVWTDSSNPTKGSGIVVANIDSGVRGTHEALKDNWRGGDFSWFDGFTNNSTGVPDDQNGHGTHVMGIISGQNGIGVAPEATWIACRGCDGNGSCPETPLLTCGQWIMCPYTIKDGNKTEDCTKKPRIVNNSWSGGGGLVPVLQLSLSNGATFYNQVIDNWKKVGIIPTFAAGNAGPNCCTTGVPANQATVLSSVGATQPNDTIASFSSKGPSSPTLKKPEVSAPGFNIMSAWNANDKAYATLSGTSMASPHVAGAIALLLAKNPNLTYEQVMQALENTAFKPSLGNSCDCDSTCITKSILCMLTLPTTMLSMSTTSSQNNINGFGRIDVFAAYKAV